MMTNLSPTQSAAAHSFSKACPNKLLQLQCVQCTAPRLAESSSHELDRLLSVLSSGVMCCRPAAEDYAAALRIDEQRRKGGDRSARSGDADDAAVSLIKAVYRPASSGEHVMPALSPIRHRSNRSRPGRQLGNSASGCVIAGEPLRSMLAGAEQVNGAASVVGTPAADATAGSLLTAVSVAALAAAHAARDGVPPDPSTGPEFPPVVPEHPVPTAQTCVPYLLG